MCKIWSTCNFVSGLTSVIVTQLGGGQRGGGGGGVVSVDEKEAEDDDETHGEENASIEQMFLQTELSQDLGHTPPGNVLLLAVRIVLSSHLMT